MGAEIHHRTQDFRDLYLSVLAGLKAVLATANDVLILAASGTGAMEASITNCFSPGDRVIVCSAGKFGERWVELAQAYGLNALVLSVPYGSVVEPATLAKALAANPDAKGVFVQAVGKLHRAAQRHPCHGRNREGHPGPIHRRRQYHRHRHHAARYRRLGFGIS